MKEKRGTDFLFVYEHINREIENDVLIMHELEQRGYTCELVSFYGPDYVKRRLLGKKASVVVAPWMRFDEDFARFAGLAMRPYKIVNFQCEQVTSDMSASATAVNSNYAKKVFHFCWGKARQDELMAQGIEKRLLPVVGAVQMDYGRKRFDAYFYSKEYLANQFSLDKRKGWCLFISSFSIVSWSSQAVASASKTYGGWMKRFFDLSVKSQKTILDWVERFCLEHKEMEFIYRPHPSETSIDRLKKMVNKLPNFHIISDYSVKQWGKVCENVNLWISTSNAELHALGVGYHILRPIKIPLKFEMHSYIGEETIDDYHGFEKANINVVGEQEMSASIVKRDKQIRRFYSFDPELPAYVRVANELERILYLHYKGVKIDKQLERRGRRELLKDIVKSAIFVFDAKFPQIKIIHRLPLKEDTKKLLFTRSKNYAGKEEMRMRMDDYLARYVEI